MTNVQAVVNTEKNTDDKIKILVVFNRIGDFRDKIYQGFLDEIGDVALVDLYVQQMDNSTASHFDKTINEKIARYDYIAIMLHSSHLSEDVLKVVNTIPREKLLILDKRNQFIKGEYACVYQDFEGDILTALNQALPLLEKYSGINLISSQNYPFAHCISNALSQFAKQHHFDFHFYTEVNQTTIRSEEAYLILSEQYLADTIKITQELGYQLGVDIGLVSYHDSPLKEILAGGITVVTTDHAQLGRSAASLILTNKKEHIRNPFLFIQRASL
ncbi:MAG: hypothetical protein ACOVOW_07120 [Spirosomataceae bacterium]|nr:hypothetical protein [Flectobacillus sp.]